MLSRCRLWNWRDVGYYDVLTSFGTVIYPHRFNLLVKLLLWMNLKLLSSSWDFGGCTHRPLKSRAVQYIWKPVGWYMAPRPLPRCQFIVNNRRRNYCRDALFSNMYASTAPQKSRESPCQESLAELLHLGYNEDGEERLSDLSWVLNPPCIIRYNSGRLYNVCWDIYVIKHLKCAFLRVNLRV